MRMRKKKHADERLAACGDFLTEAPIFSEDDTVFLEIGAGKGGFAVGMCEKFPDVKYFAMERVTDCVVIAAERAKQISSEGASCQNLKFIIDTADNLTRLFPENSVDRIFLNFSDPWSKKGYAKRRLMHARYLKVYMNLLKDGGVLRFKTDNVGLFEFSLEQIQELSLKPSVVTRDLHASEWQSDNVITEYEANFSSQGIKINMLELIKPAGFMPQIDDDLKSERVERNPKIASAKKQGSDC